MTVTARVFENGRSRGVLVERQGDVLVLRPKPSGWNDFFPASPACRRTF